MSYKHIKVGFSIDITDHKRDKRYLQEKVLESLGMVVEHVKKNGVTKTLVFDEDGLVPLDFRCYRRKYPYCSDTFHSLEGDRANALTREKRLDVAKKTVEKHNFAIFR